MLIESTLVPSTDPRLRASQVARISSACLVLGLAAGYLLRSSQSATPQLEIVPARAALPASANSGNSARPPTLDEMRHMADQRAQPVLEKLKGDPENATLLAQAGSIYHASHQFNEAVAWYRKAVARDPGNLSLRTRLATSLYRSGAVDGAIAELNRVLSMAPTNPDALFNLGLIRLQAKQDRSGARTCWTTLLKTNPNLTSAQKDQVQRLLAAAASNTGDPSEPAGGPTQ